MNRRLTAAMLSTFLTLPVLLVVAPQAAEATTYSATLRQAARSLTVAAEVRTGYDRDKFKLWTDADGDGCDTRDEVLIAEATRAPTIGADCSLSGGKWFSYYDKETTTEPSTFDIDHVVPLAEAWDSGARAWTAATRKRYANDLGDPRALVAVTAHANRSKSDRDPAEWMPTYRKCRYVKQWVVVKIRWHLTANRAEKRFLVSKADSCAQARLKVTKARVVKKQ